VQCQSCSQGVLQTPPVPALQAQVSIDQSGVPILPPGWATRVVVDGVEPYSLCPADVADYDKRRTAAMRAFINKTP
jgi:hypothetical protein